MSATLTSSRDDILAQVEPHEWIHTIDLGHGVITPGRWPIENKTHIVEAIDRVDFHGKKVLDIGCLDGLFSFDAERRGASKVVATDLVTQVYPPRDTTFEVAHKILGSGAEYHPDLSVYDVGRLGIDDFDVVLYLGVYYHLRDPLLAFARLRRVMKEGAIIVIEGEVISDEKESLARYYYNEHFASDKSNWWVPTIRCLREWVESSFFEIVEDRICGPTHGYHYTDDMITGRHVIIAKAVSKKDPNWAFPDPDFRGIDLKDYTREH